MEYVIPDPPPVKASRSSDPLEPIEVWTVSMPSTPSRASSTTAAASSWVVRLAVSPTFCMTVRVF